MCAPGGEAGGAAFLLRSVLARCSPGMVAKKSPKLSVCLLSYSTGPSHQSHNTHDTRHTTHTSNAHTVFVRYTGWGGAGAATGESWRRARWADVEEVQRYETDEGQQARCRGGGRVMAEIDGA